MSLGQADQHCTLSQPAQIVPGVKYLSTELMDILYESIFQNSTKFEKSVITKPHKANASIIMLDGLTCSYKSSVDLSFYVVESGQQNELLLMFALDFLFNTCCGILRENVDKKSLCDSTEVIMIAPDEMIDGDPPASHVLTTGSAPQSPGPSPQHPRGEESVPSGGSLARPVQKMKSLTIKPKFLPRTTGIAALLTSLHLIAASGETYAYSPVMSTLFPNNLPWNARSNATTALTTGSCSTVAPAWVSSSCSVLVSSDQVSDLCRSAHVLEQNGDLRPFSQLQHGLHIL